MHAVKFVFSTEEFFLWTVPHSTFLYWALKVGTSPEAGGLNQKLENTRELLIPGNINRQELIQKPPYLY